MAKEYAIQFYGSKDWKLCRAYVRKRDGYQCQLCTSGSAEEVHHIIELTPENINDPKIALNPDNLISLCRQCHSNITKGYTGDVVDGYKFSDDGQVIKI